MSGAVLFRRGAEVHGMSVSALRLYFGFLAAGLAAGFAVVFLAAGFFAAGLRGAGRRGGLRGALARRSASSSAARCTVSDSTSSPLRSEALVSPSVTYGPNRPSLTTIGLPVPGSSPISRSGGVAAPRARPRALGWENRSLASARVSVNSWSSLSSERLSVPFFTYGP